MHEQASDVNLAMTESVHLTHQNSRHTLTNLAIKSHTNDNHNLVDNRSVFNNNCTLTLNTVDCVSLSKFSDIIAPSRHEFHKDSSSTAVVLSYSEDRFNNNCDSVSTSGIGNMSHKNFMLTFDHQNLSSSPPQALSSSETLLSPAEAPFGRRYAEISQFKNHPNVEW
jgi:hypothetical protein